MESNLARSPKVIYTIGAKMITCRKNCFEQLIIELHRITVHPFLFARINSGCNVMVSLSCAPAYREKGNHKGICLHYITRRGAPSELINFPDYITCILKAHRNLECNDFVPNGSLARSPKVIYKYHLWHVSPL